MIARAARRAARRVPARAAAHARPARPRIVLQARTIDPASPGRNLPLIGTPIAVPADAPPPVWVSEAAVDLYDFTPGRIIELPLAGRVERFTVAGVWRDYGRQQGVIAIERSRYIALTGDRTVTNGALWLAGGRRARGARGDDAPRDSRRRAPRNRAPGRNSRRFAAECSTAPSRSPMPSSSRRWSSVSSASRRRSARSCSRAGANSACCAISA